MKPSEQRNAVMAALRPIYKGALDGVFGPKFDAAVAELRALIDPADAAPAEGAGALLRKYMVEEFRKLVGAKETDGSNQSPVINALWASTNYPDGWKDRAPYCAATVCAVAHRAAERACPDAATRPPLPVSPSCAGMLDWAQDAASKCLVFIGAAKYTPQAGDIVSFLPHLSHTGILEQDYDGSGFLHTLEGNTNGAGARDGDGIWAKTRPIGLAGHFIRLAALA